MAGLKDTIDTSFARLAPDVRIAGYARETAVISQGGALSVVPYTKNPSSISKLLKHMQSAGVPTKVTVQYLKTVGFTSSNDGYLVTLLKSIDFVDSGGKPTERWSAYRGGNGKQALAEAVRVGYSDLFATYPDANLRDDEAIANFVRGHTTYSAQTVSRAVASFKALCAEADFGAVSNGSSPGPGQPNNGGQVSNEGHIQPVLSQTVRGRGGSLTPTVNINIELHLQPSTDAAMYDAFFKAMKEHLFQ